MGVWFFQNSKMEELEWYTFTFFLPCNTANTTFRSSLWSGTSCTIIYWLLRHRCWINESPFSVVLVVPVCMSMALNLIFLCNIVRVLWIKLQAGPSHLSNSTPSRTLLQAFRATLLLLPLLGLHYLLTPFRPPKQHPWEPFYEVVSATTSSFQVNYIQGTTQS